ILAVIGAASLGACRVSELLPIDLGILWELTEHQARTLSEIGYAIELTIPKNKDAPIEKRTTIDFVLDDPNNFPLVMDFREPAERVRTVRVNRADAAWKPVNDHVMV